MNEELETVYGLPPEEFEIVEEIDNEANEQVK